MFTKIYLAYSNLIIVLIYNSTVFKKLKFNIEIILQIVILLLGVNEFTLLLVRSASLRI